VLNPTGAEKGQYSDGHERDDVVWYREKVFVPAWQEIQGRMKNWTKDNKLESTEIEGKYVIGWHHDETIFYAK